MTYFDKLRIASFNINGLKSSVSRVQELCELNDIIFLQETLLLPHDCDMFNHVHTDFYGLGFSHANVTDHVLRGRPPGGLGVLWRKELEQFVKFHPLPSCERAICLQFTCPNMSPWYLIGVYLPFDSGTVDSLVAYTEALTALESCVSMLDCSRVLCIGDFNAAYSPHKGAGGRFMEELTVFCEDNEWTMVDIDMLNDDTFTYLSPAHSTTSWLDHVVVSHALLSSVISCTVNYDISEYDHMPLTCTLQLPCPTPLGGGSEIGRADPVPLWGRASVVHKNHYAREVAEGLAMVDWEADASPDRVYRDLLDILTHAAQNCIPLSGPNQGRHKVHPGWNGLVREKHLAARSAFHQWRLKGKQREGPEHVAMISTRKAFRQALRTCKAMHDKLRRDNLAASLLGGRSREFWGAVRRLSPKPPLPVSVDGRLGGQPIADHWGDTMSATFAGTRVVIDPPPEACDEIHPVPADLLTSAQEIQFEAKHLQKGKAAGPDGIGTEHICFAPDVAYEALAFLFNRSLMVGMLPDGLTDSNLIPLVKNRQGDLTSSKNYRGICISSVIAKLFEKIMLRKLTAFLVTDDSQFGFKPATSTHMASFVVEAVIDEHNARGSPVYVAFLDATKAFDNVAHDLLFAELEERGVPECYLRVLRKWYERGNVAVKWGKHTSTPFAPTKGVRQGSCLSPLLFNVYVDRLVKTCRSSGVGCTLNGVACNIVVYADDIALLAPSFGGLQRLLDVCGGVAESLNIVFNAAKSTCVFFNGSAASGIPAPSRLVSIQGNVLNWSDSAVHLGHVFSSNLGHAADVGRTRRSFLRSLNLVLSRFAFCSKEVKIALFTAFCSHLYGCELWSRIPRRVWRELQVCLHTAIKRLGGFPVYARNSLSCLDMGLLTMDRHIALKQLGFYKSVIMSGNSLVQAVLSSEKRRELSFFRRIKEVCTDFGLLNVCLREERLDAVKHYLFCHQERYAAALAEYDVG